jgi:hypothetical protein
VPKSKKQLKAFLGLAGYYRKFVRFGPNSQATTQANWQEYTVCLGRRAREGLSNAERYLCSEPSLQYPDFEKEFIVTCDASSNGIGIIEGV